MKQPKESTLRNPIIADIHISPVDEGEENMVYDAAIIGTGPAGLSAAINLKLHRKSVIWFGPRELSEKVEKSQMIRNYPGFPEISGSELNRRMQEHARGMELEITDRIVTNVMPSGALWMLLAQNELYQAKTLLLAVGVASEKGFGGEKELLGRGVSYCATCDGFLYKGKTIAVFCKNRRYEHEAADLAAIAGTVYFYPAYPDCTLHLPNVKILQKPIRRVLGEDRVTGIELIDGSSIAADGFFCLRDSVAPAALLPSLSLEGPHIAVNRRMETSMPGCFAAGDCTGRPYQIAKAAGEGNTAAHSMLGYLAGAADQA